MSWASRYVGTPYADHGRSRAGVDCWGLACVVYAQELGIVLPSYAGAYASAEEIDEVDALLYGAKERQHWRQVPSARPFDLFEFRTGGRAAHVGIALDARRMLHVHAGGAALVEPLQPRWITRRIGIYRHINMYLRGA
ncbi:C40 family peptidase [Antarcticimicrobium sediminis]|uniref:C40 family peptidase n=1 Tax=Antarcticimicrobium sediminis TaxID=2546227 RepID=UPI0014053CAA|nr:NlpC/P60 family protein [Antarcticimicrobium sediminis]